MARLLVSVRSVTEGIAALEGGADLIDVKEPGRGSLGRADEAIIAAVCRRVGGRRPVSAALGELLDFHHFSTGMDLAFVKWGLAGCRLRSNWPDLLKDAAASVIRQNPACRPVAAAYADWRRAGSPAPADVCTVIRNHGFKVFLLDTWCKDGRSLLDWLSISELGRLCDWCRSAGIQVALAGSLDSAAIGRLQELEPTWFAVRGAVCRDSCRTRVIDPRRVRELADRVHSFDPVAIPEN
jgi:(5-formylfuran-3-yl)methyl phosphate synthase